MAAESVDFDEPRLAARLEQLSPDDIDALPYGVIHLDRELKVVLYSKVEARQSGFGRQPVGESFFPLTCRMGTDDFRGRIERAMADGDVDLEFGWSGDFNDPKRDMHIRVQSARDGGVWVCIERDPRGRG